MGIKVNLTLDRDCKQCGQSELDHPCNCHILYYSTWNGGERVYDWYSTKDDADDTLEKLIDTHGNKAVMDDYKFRYYYGTCDGEF